MNKRDVEELSQMVSLMRQFTGFKCLEGIENILHKLELLVFESIRPSKQIVQIEQAATIPGQKWLDSIYKAIRDEQTLQLSYKPFVTEMFHGPISPYLLKEYRNRWFLFAHSHTVNQLRTYGLERIIDLKPSFTAYRKNCDFDGQRYFHNIMGISLEPGDEKQEIVFKVFGNQVNYIRTKSLHASQKELATTEKYSIFQIEVIPNWEMESALFAFGESVQIISPIHLVERFKNRTITLA